MWSSRLIPPFLLLSLAFGQSNQDRLRLGPVHLKAPEHIEMLVELPEGVVAGVNDFQLVEDGEPTVHAKASTKFRDSGWTLAVVLAVDISKSLRKLDIEEVKKALTDFASQFKDSLALVTFGDEANVVASFETPPAELINHISALSPIGKRTRLYEALDKSLALFQARPERERQRIIVLSDGAEESEERANLIDEIIAKAERPERRRVAIDTIWIERRDPLARNTLVRLAEQTDGFHDDAKLAGQIQTALGKVMDRTNQAVVVSFERKLREAGVTTRHLGVNVGSATASKALQTPIPKSFIEPPTPAPWWKILLDKIAELSSWLMALLAALTLYVLYLVTYIIVRKYFPERLVLFPFCPFPLTQEKEEITVVREPPKISELPKLPEKSKRQTRVEHTAEPLRRAVQAGVLVLQAVKGPLEGQRIPVEKDFFRIGADPDNDLPISSDIYLSGQHAAIQASGGQWILVDRGSRNGTFVDGRKVTKGPGQSLQPGQSIQVGTSEFRVIIEGHVSTLDSQLLR